MALWLHTTSCEKCQDSAIVTKGTIKLSQRDLQELREIADTKSYIVDVLQKYTEYPPQHENNYLLHFDQMLFEAILYLSIYSLRT